MHNAMDFLMKHGYIVIFVAVFIEQIGLPVPSGPVLLAAGRWWGFTVSPWQPIFALAVAASLICDSLWFSLGRRRGVSVLKFVCIEESPSSRKRVFPGHIPLICAMAPNRS